jgi:NADH:ubiquinone oxidoreductase subunit 3 (subunit A)
MNSVLLNPVTAALIFAGFGAGLYWLGGHHAARGDDAPGKHLPYACGEDLPSSERRVSYQRFFRLALMFVVVHMATLVVAMLPLTLDARLLGTVYLVGVAICIDALIKE